MVLAVAAELFGVLLFSLLGGTAPAQLAPWANGFALAVLIYITANISGGHLNPVWAGGRRPWSISLYCMQSCKYIIKQVRM